MSTFPTGGDGLRLLALSSKGIPRSPVFCWNEALTCRLVKETTVLDEYFGTYHDKNGAEAIIVRNDGTDLHMTVRGVEFRGHSMSGMEPKDKTERPELARFTLHRSPHEAVDLCACTIDYVVPLPVSDQEALATGLLSVHTELGMPAERGWLDREVLRLTLSVGGKTYQSRGKSGWFEDELLEIQAALPEGVLMKACINCALCYRGSPLRQ